jgi:uncharacterized small protein (DUF1192 family)
MTGYRTLAAALALILTACGKPGGSNPTTGATPPAAVMTETRMFLTSGCPVSGNNKELAPILLAAANILLPVIIDKTFDIAASAARKAGEAKTTEIPATAGGMFYRVGFKDEQPQDISRHGDLGCIVVVRAPFGDTSGNGPEFTSKAWKDLQSTDLQSSLGKLGIAGEPLFYYEAWASLSPDRLAFRLSSQRLIYLDNFDKGVFGSKGERDLVLDFTFRKPAGNDSEDSAFGHSQIVFNDLKPGVVANSNALLGKATPWMPLPSIEDRHQQILSAAVTRTGALATAKRELAALQAPAPPTPIPGSAAAIRAAKQSELDQKNRELAKKTSSDKPDVTELRHRIAALEAEIALLDTEIGKVQLITAKNQQIKTMTEEQGAAAKALSGFAPFNLTVTVRETKDANKYLLALADILDASKADLKTAAKDRLVPANRDRVKSDRQTQEDATQRNVLSKQNAVDEAQADLDKALADPDADKAVVAKLRSALALAKFDANIAYRDAGRAIPYP